MMGDVIFRHVSVVVERRNGLSEMFSFLLIWIACFFHSSILCSWRLRNHGAADRGLSISSLVS
jgi:hypothetical protein